MNPQVMHTAADRHMQPQAIVTHIMAHETQVNQVNHRRLSVQGPRDRQGHQNEPRLQEKERQLKK